MFPTITRFSTSNEVEVRHSFNICGEGGLFPGEDVPGFTAAVQELSGDMKQLATMILTVRFSLLNPFFQSFEHRFKDFKIVSKILK